MTERSRNDAPREALVEQARANAGFLTLGQGADAGLSDSQMRRLVRLGEWQRVGRGVRRLSDADPTDPWRDGVRKALLTAGVGAVAAGYTAARLHGLIGAPPSARLWIAVPLERHPQQRAGVRILRTALDASDNTHVDSIPTTTVVRTLLDCARHGDALAAVCLVESAARLDPAVLHGLRAAVRKIHGQRGSVRAATALARADVRSESPLETKARLLLLDEGFPYPEPQYPFADGDVRRIDLAYLAPNGSPYTGLAIEIDGREHHAREAAFHADPRRQTALEEAGWLVRRFTDHHLSDREYVVQTVRRALERIAVPPN